MSKKVFLDAGHGGTDPGAIGVNNLLEKDINLQVTKKVEALLKKQGIDVKLSRTDDKFISLTERSNMANTWKADCFVSIHCNAFNKLAKGIETFSSSQNTSNLAKDVHSELLNTKAYTLNRGTKTANYSVLTRTNMRACLVELGFIDNVDDAKILVEKQDDLALGIAKGICKFLNIEYKTTPVTPPAKPVTPPVNDSKTFYRVVCGSFVNIINAEERLEQLKALGFDGAFITAYNQD